MNQGEARLPEGTDGNDGKTTVPTAATKEQSDIHCMIRRKQAKSAPSSTASSSGSSSSCILVIKIIGKVKGCGRCSRKQICQEMNLPAWIIQNDTNGLNVGQLHPRMVWSMTCFWQTCLNILNSSLRPENIGSGYPGTPAELKGTQKFKWIRRWKQQHLWIRLDARKATWQPGETCPFTTLRLLMPIPAPLYTWRWQHYQWWYLWSLCANVVSVIYISRHTQI